MKIETIHIDQIVPYWRNPRRIPDEAVNAVAESIRRYGYQQPIVVDEKFCIIIGHTRMQALRRLGVKAVPVHVVTDLPEDKIKQLRVLDNRTAELNSWDFEKLGNELMALDQQLMNSFFPELTLQDQPDPHVTAGGGVVEGARDVSESDDVGIDDTIAEFVCPLCFATVQAKVTMKALQKGKLKAEAAA